MGACGFEGSAGSGQRPLCKNSRSPRCAASGGGVLLGKAGSPSLSLTCSSRVQTQRAIGGQVSVWRIGSWQAFEREAIMDRQAWGKALELYVNTPELIYASIFAAIAIFGFAWWLRNHISKERIAALQERLRLGKEGQEHIKNELDSLKQKVSLQEAIINDLRSTGGVPRTQVELLNSANATVVSSLADLEQANTDLGETLSLRV